MGLGGLSTNSTAPWLLQLSHAMNLHRNSAALYFYAFVSYFCNCIHFCLFLNEYVFSMMSNELLTISFMCIMLFVIFVVYYYFLSSFIRCSFVRRWFVRSIGARGLTTFTGRTLILPPPNALPTDSTVPQLLRQSNSVHPSRIFAALLTFTGRILILPPPNALPTDSTVP